jgi:hypothetical protein
LNALTIAALGAPPLSLQLGGPAFDSGDNRVMTSVFAGGKIWSSTSDSCTPGGDSTARSCLRLMQISVSGAQPALLQDFDLGLPGQYASFPAATFTSNGDTYLTYTLSSASTYASAATAFQPGGAPNIILRNTIEIAGAGPYIRTAPVRWGDYMGVAFDPADANGAWLVAEYAGSSNLWATAITNHSNPHYSPYTILLRNSNSSGNNDVPTYTYGEQPDQILFCDWDGSGTYTPAVVRETIWYIRNSNTSGVADVAPFSYGNPGDKVVCGDWDGNGTQTPGVYRGNTWYLRNSNTSGVADIPAFSYGNAGDTPLVGNWNTLGVPKTDHVGLWRAGVFYLNNTFTSFGNSGFNFGNSTDTPVVGDWNGDHQTSIGIWRAAGWYLNDQNDSSAADYVFGYGDPTDHPVTGNWNGSVSDFTVTPGVTR